MALALAAAEPHRGACTRIEASGFAGIWVGDPLGRTLDPLTELAALAAVTATLRDRRLTLPTSTAHNRRGGG
jgi:alkanesulfonate monooxygenase SsuD/methylene tetrahydromethanopterin reductase-like flavin-dependent oxidoreductase (luciferase family)